MNASKSRPEEEIHRRIITLAVENFCGINNPLSFLIWCFKIKPFTNFEFETYHYRPFTSVIRSVRRGGGKGYQHNMRAVHAVVGTVKIELISALCDFTRLIYRLRQQVESAVLFNFIE